VTKAPALRIARGQAAFSRGLWAESRVADALRREGWTIRAQRVRTVCGEIDLVAQYRQTVAFIEIKARADFALAAESVSPRQIRRITEGAALWLAEHDPGCTLSARFDIVTVNKKGAMRRIADAFRQT